MLCLDYWNLQEKRNINKLYNCYRAFISCLCGLSIFYKRDVSTDISLGWNKISGCYIKPATFWQCDNAFSQHMSAFAPAIATCRRELERLLKTKKIMDK